MQADAAAPETGRMGGWFPQRNWSCGSYTACGGLLPRVLAGSCRDAAGIRECKEVEQLHREILGACVNPYDDMWIVASLQ
jgi:hypothetical protein